MLLKILSKRILSDEHSFKLVGSAQDVFKQPGHLVFVVAVLLFSMVAANVTNGPVVAQPLPSQPHVLGKATALGSDDDIENRLAMYKLSVQSLLIPYFEQRVSYLALLDTKQLAEADRRDWQGLNNQAQKEFMELVVPERFKDTHLLIVAALMEESALLDRRNSEFSLSSFEGVNKRWEDMLLRNSWLNEREEF